MWWLLSQVQQQGQPAEPIKIEIPEALGFEKLVWMIVFIAVGMTIFSVVVDVVIRWIRSKLY